MKKRNKIIISMIIAGIVLILIIWFIFLALNPEPHFKIYKNESNKFTEEELIEICKLESEHSKKTGECENVTGLLKEVNEIRLIDNVETIKKTELSKEWLEENCECYYKNLNCNKYVCEEYLVEVWMQGK